MRIQRAVLQAGTRRDADRISVGYSTAFPEIELRVGGEPILSGAWELALRIGDRNVVLDASAWECVCQHSDRDGDYFELQQISLGVRIERQIFLARRGRFALFSDCIAEAPQGTIEYQTRLPTIEPASTLFGKVSREGRVVLKGGPVVRVFPLGLPSLRQTAASGRFDQVEGKLELRQTVTGTGLFAPMILDWDPSRRRSAAEWRSLTITEDRRVLADDQASAFRLRIGKKQLFLYRALTPPADGRAVLGYNTRYETVLGWFTPEGRVDSLVSIEG